ncbi:MAG: hypothetical protein ACJ739_10435 [Acidimicrobiales bacterium]
MRVLASELWWVALVVAGAQGVRLGASMWAILPAAYLVDICLTLQLEVVRPLWLWLLNVLVLSIALQLGKGLSTIEAVHEVPADPPPSPPTAAQQAMAEDLRAEGFVPVAPTAVLVGDPEMVLWVLVRGDGTFAELVHAEPRAPGFAFRTELDPPAPGYDTVESVPWKRGFPSPTTRRLALPKATWPALLAAHDAALAEAVREGARPVPVAIADALANVLDSDRAAARRVLERPWRSMAHLYGLGRRPRSAG